ncbi:hypothetical protein [Tenacibaculum finnmarkense]|uniref:hypothetical protein n=1 Tax=Tenacibaculum finnmarkense TaxID=2781243 RepID=UPI0023013918|nr:hypothetical protein [Tenacibaculum finnmarkense]WCC46220.1 hypothetical protein PJH08_07370 [Tenacibaculum finnmarkense]
MYEVFLKSWYQEMPNETQEEIMGEFDHIEDAFDFLKKNAKRYIEFYPLEEMGVRIKKINCLYYVLLWRSERFNALQRHVYVAYFSARKICAHTLC